MSLFLGRLKRHRVRAPYKHGVELPSDYKGVVYVGIEGGDAWETKLAREIEQLIADLDPNLLR